MGRRGDTNATRNGQPKSIRGVGESDFLSADVTDVNPKLRANVDVGLRIGALPDSSLTVGSAGAACDACAPRNRDGVRLHFPEGTLTKLLDEFRPPPLPSNFVYSADRFLADQRARLCHATAEARSRGLDHPWAVPLSVPDRDREC